MKILVSVDAHLYRTPDNQVWCESIYEYEFWKRYLSVFDEVRVLSRIKNVDKRMNKWLKTDGPRVEVYGIPFFQGPIQLVSKLYALNNVLRKAYNGCDTALFRIPSSADVFVYNAKPKNMPFAVEVVYDPTDGINGKNDLFHYIIRRLIIKNIKKMCIKANGVSYVTQEAIQRHFPSYVRVFGEDNKHFETYYSTITLSDDAFGIQRNFKDKKKFQIAHSDVCMNSERKGEIILLESINIVRNAGYDVNVVFIGDGKLRNKFEVYAKRLGIDNYTTFTGLVPSAREVRSILLQSDIFVFPTLAEGLPRGMLEAMAVGLPCISSPVGGIPEILSSNFLCNPKDPKAIANLIISLINNTDKMEQVSLHNIETAKKYRNEVLQAKRVDFYRRLYNCCRQI